MTMAFIFTRNSKLTSSQIESLMNTVEMISKVVGTGQNQGNLFLFVTNYFFA